MRLFRLCRPPVFPVESAAQDLSRSVAANKRRVNRRICAKGHTAYGYDADGAENVSALMDG
jgi:hypothetical protein